MVGIKARRMMSTDGAKKTADTKAKGPARAGASQISDPGDWREETLERVLRTVKSYRAALILEAEPEMTEERKWRKPSNGMLGVPVWSHNGIVCTGETYRSVVKLTFAKGASLPDPSNLFNAGLEGNTRRAIDIHEGEAIDAAAFKALVKAAAAHNGSKKSK